MNVRLHKHSHAIEVNPSQLLRSFRNSRPAEEHWPEVRLDSDFLMKIQQNYREIEAQEQMYSKVLEEIERMRQLVLFHERERQYLIVLNLTNEKI